MREIHLTFDSGFQRELILSMSDYVTKKIVRGPQPELVRAYRVLAGDQVVVTETKLFAQTRAPPGHANHRAIASLEISATHGSPTARLFEVRIY